MTGTLAQLISLVAYGNQYILNKDDRNSLPANHTTFQFCNRVTFSLPSDGDPSQDKSLVVIAENPIKWFIYLAEQGCKALRLYYQGTDGSTGVQDHKLAGMIGGGGSWFIEVIHTDYSDFWYGVWEVNRENAPDNQIWAVDYRLLQPRTAIRNQQLDLDMQKEKLAEALTEIEAFAYEMQVENFAKVFARANASLNDPHPEMGYYHTNLLPENNYSITARQTLFSAARAWVFGGMGSWNDMGFAAEYSQQRYEQLSAKLYNAINDSVIASVNHPEGDIHKLPS